jgi:outer membrane biosynthesis protein TonB
MFSSLFASTQDSRSDGVFGRVKTSVGRLFGADDEKPAPMAKPAAPTPTPKPAARPNPAPAAAAQPKPQPRSAEPEQTAQAPAPTPTRQSSASGASLMSGAAPTVPTGSFDARWGAVR